MKVQVPPFVHSFPAPAVLIGCGTVNEPNIVTVSWFGTVCSEPPTISVSVRPERFSHHLIEESREFTVNIPRVSDVKALKYCGNASGRDRNKFRDLGLTPLPCPPLKRAPMIAEFFQVLACEVKEILELGTHHMFVAEIVAMYCDDDKKKSALRPDLFPTDQVVYLDGKFWKLAEIG